jgi:RNA polymerase sigma factor (sigma-70 family)
MEITEKTLTVEEITTYYESIKNMIWHIIHQFNNIPVQDKEDIFQDASIFVTTKLVYKYDKTKNVEFKDFAYICIKNFVLRKINNFNKYKKNILADSDLLKVLPEDVDPSSIKDDIDKVAAIKRLLDSDSELLKENEKTILKMIFENPSITQREMSEKMGFHFASGTGAILNRLRRRIKEDNMLDDV